MTLTLTLAATTFVIGYWRGRRARKAKAKPCKHGGPAIAGERCLKCVADQIAARRR